MKTDLDKLEYYYDCYKEAMLREFSQIKFKLFEIRKLVDAGVITEATAFETVSTFANECMYNIDEHLSNLDCELFGVYLDGDLQ